MFETGIMVGIALYALLVSYRCTFRVSEGHLAVLTTFGAVQKADARNTLRTFSPGLHFKLPWQQVVTVPMMEQSLDLSGEELGRTAMADDGTVLRFDSILRYVPVEEDLEEFLFGLRAPLEHITALFTCLLRNEIANFRMPAGSITKDAQIDFVAQAGSYALIRRERNRLNHHIAEFAREKIGNRYGVRFNAVDLTDILPPDELADALNAVMQAHSEAETHYFRAEGDCRQRILGAERGVDIAKARALAIQTEITALARSLQTLHKDGSLKDYVSRRREEVFSEARLRYVKEPHA
jgi:regulator of protease activity HflC (stomatin/prohibitin superfamily)